MWTQRLSTRPNHSAYDERGFDRDFAHSSNYGVARWWVKEIVAHYRNDDTGHRRGL